MVEVELSYEDQNHRHPLMFATVLGFLYLNIEFGLISKMTATLGF